MNWIVRGGAIVAMLLSLAMPAFADSRIDSRALRALFPGTFSVRIDGIPATFVASHGGRLVGKAVIGSDSGRWSVRGRLLCISLRNMYDGKTKCMSVRQNGSWYRTRDFSFRRI